MKKLLFLFFFVIFGLNASTPPWSPHYQKFLKEKVAEETERLASYPSEKYPNRNYQKIVQKYPEEKVLIFSYGSLMNKASASRSLSEEAVESMIPVMAFGVKRIFNYKAGNISRWGTNLPDNERAMLNVDPTPTISSMINGVVLEVNQENLKQLIDRETGYDLAPVLFADWNELMAENPDVKIKVAYMFYVPDELRGGVDYTQTKYYPVRGYLHAVQDGAAEFGEPFLKYWNDSTFMGDGTTPITQWDQETFSGILDSKEP